MDKYVWILTQGGPAGVAGQPRFHTRQPTPQAGSIITPASMGLTQKQLDELNEINAINTLNPTTSIGSPSPDSNQNSSHEPTPLTP